MEGNDHTVSLLPEEFASMVKQIRDVEISLGTSSPREVSTGELMNRTTLAKSLVAARNLEIGRVLTIDDIAIKSPGRGIQPNRISELLGLKLTRQMQEGDFFFAGDLNENTPRARPYKFKRDWGLPVRYHDFRALIGETQPDFVEFHFSYRDLEIDLDSIFTEPLDMRFTTHLPDLFAGDFMVDLASLDDEVWNRSILETQRTIDVTRKLKKWFPGNYDPVMVATLGGFTKDGFLAKEDRAERYARLAKALSQLDTEGITLAAQTLPPFPWLMGGQNFHNLFLDPSDTVAFAESTGIKLCLDISHTQLAANHLGISLSEAVEQLAVHTVHLHLVDAVGVDGEGVQVGSGEVDWAALAKQLDRIAPNAPFIPEIWQGHVNNGEGFWVALDKLENWF
jgi:N-acetylneuraminate synthase